MRIIILLAGLLLGSASSLFAQVPASSLAPAPATLTGPQVVQRSIAYHDPQGRWPALRQRLHFTTTNATGKESRFEVELDNPGGYFCYISHPEGHEVIKAVVNGQEVLLLDGRADLTEAERKQYRLAPGIGNFMRNYYTYLYGLPMKLQDAGTQILADAAPKDLLGQTYTTARVNYEPAIGQDSWTFYFNPRTFALQAYQFYHNHTPSEGEYIMLQDEILVEGVRIPKQRKWYLNKDQSFLATDLLLRAEPLTTRRL
ncbi:DUF6503 family protein [Hymenobacter glacialis]|uniref:Uncharacterized protein n=1 Tax=Hymenobacter glacialis TaxID=1908236 RepID=A0A1G1SWD8_9BACT|nr:DUF6503 family protein [Hymenobacter glacialis]OGX82936.1 hypothetical protein BEN48_04005 [Hymenobacter glacialis]